MSATNPAALAVAGWRQQLVAFVERPLFTRTLLGLILLNAVVLGLQTSPRIIARWGSWLEEIDQFILAVFVIEITMRIVAYGPRFFRDPWSVFDFTVVGVALLPAAETLSVLRAMRVLRVLRMLTLVPSMRRVVRGLLASIPGLASVIAVLVLVFYVGAVIATHLFGSQFDDWFGSVGASLYSLFQIMTLESWSMGIARPVIKQYPYAWAFFVPFIIIATFTMLNLFIAVIVSAIQAEADADLKTLEQEVIDHTDQESATIRAEIRALRDEVSALRSALLAGGQPPLDQAHVKRGPEG